MSDAADERAAEIRARDADATMVNGVAGLLEAIAALSAKIDPAQSIVERNGKLLDQVALGLGIDTSKY